MILEAKNIKNLKSNSDFIFLSAEESNNNNNTNKERNYFIYFLCDVLQNHLENHISH